MKKIANRRSGDRAEALGVVLMELFCAVAAVPRQEDCGIFDAVATLLRRGGRLLYPEDSFSVQFKSRTEKVIEYLGERFESLMNHELELFIAHVDLTAAGPDIRLYRVGRALEHPNIHEMKGLVVHLDPFEQRCEDHVLHSSLGAPVLEWSTAELADEEFEQKAYTVMRKLLELERWNRRYRKMGVQTQIRWTTNQVPSQGPITGVWNPARANEALSDIVPAIQVIAGIALSDASLAEAVDRLIASMRAHGVELDPTGVVGLSTLLRVGQEQLDNALETHPQADVGVQFIPTGSTGGVLEFWLQSAGRKGSSARKYNGSVGEIQALGFDVEIDPGSQKIAAIGLGAAWLKEHNFGMLGRVDAVFLLRTAEPSKP